MKQEEGDSYETGGRRKTGSGEWRKSGIRRKEKDWKQEEGERLETGGRRERDKKQKVKERLETGEWRMTEKRRKRKTGSRKTRNKRK